MAVTKVFTSKTEQQYLFRFEEEIEGSHGHKTIRGVPFHVTLTMPQGIVKVSRYAYKESATLEFDIQDIPELIALLEAAKRENEELRMRSNEKT